MEERGKESRVQSTTVHPPQHQCTDLSQNHNALLPPPNSLEIFAARVPGDAQDLLLSVSLLPKLSLLPRDLELGLHAPHHLMVAHCCLLSLMKRLSPLSLFDCCSAVLVLWLPRQPASYSVCCWWMMRRRGRGSEKGVQCEMQCLCVCLVCLSV